MALVAIETAGAQDEVYMAKAFDALKTRNFKFLSFELRSSFVAPRWRPGGSVVRPLMSVVDILCTVMSLFSPLLFVCFRVRSLELMFPVRLALQIPLGRFRRFGTSARWGVGGTRR